MTVSDLTAHAIELFEGDLVGPGDGFRIEFSEGVLSPEKVEALRILEREAAKQMNMPITRTCYKTGEVCRFSCPGICRDA